MGRWTSNYFCMLLVLLRWNNSNLHLFYVSMSMSSQTNYSFFNLPLHYFVYEVCGNCYVRITLLTWTPISHCHIISSILNWCRVIIMFRLCVTTIASLLMSFTIHNVKWINIWLLNFATDWYYNVNKSLGSTNYFLLLFFIYINASLMYTHPTHAFNSYIYFIMQNLFKNVLF